MYFFVFKYAVKVFFGTEKSETVLGMYVKVIFIYFFLFGTYWS